MAILFAFLLGISTYGSIVSSQTRNKPVNFSTIALTDAQKLEIVKLHNKFRRSRYSSNMRYMTWDGELAWMAESYGRRCIDGRNRYYKKHSKFPSVGENVYASPVKAKNFQISMPIRKWYSEKSNFNYYSSTCQKGKQCGNYTQVVWAKTFKVGCALTSCIYLRESKYRNALLFICNYAAAGNVVDGPSKKLQSVYERGYPCSKCDEKTDYCRNLLCANSERDFILPPDDTQEKALIGYIVAVVALSVIVVALIAWIILQKFRTHLNPTRCCWKRPLRKVSRSTSYGTSMTTSASYTNAPTITAGDKSMPLLPREPSQTEVSTDVSDSFRTTRIVSAPVITVARRPAPLDLSQQKRGSRTSLPKPTHPAPRSPPPIVPAPVLIRS